MSRLGHRPLVLATAGLVLAAGCGPAGPQRYPVSGSVTLDGRPVPGCTLLFAPDVARGNSGPAAFAVGRDGRYETYPGHGIVGGPHLVTLTAFDTPVSESGEPVPFSEIVPAHQIEVDLPLGPARHDFEIPASRRLPPAERPRQPAGIIGD